MRLDQSPVCTIVPLLPFGLYNLFAGPVKTAALDFAGYIIPDQAFSEFILHSLSLTNPDFLTVQVTPDSEHPVNIGLIGLGPNKGSAVFDTVGNPSGDAVLDRIFKQNTSTPNFMTVLMGRYDDPTDTFPG
jgi:hypothetical protein